MQRSPRWTIALALTLLAAVWPGPARTQGSDAAAKARFVVTFVRFVQWPASPIGIEAPPLRLCLLQHSPVLANAFIAQDGANVGGRRLVVVLQSPPGLAGCDALFVDDSGVHGAAGLLAQATQRPLLTLGAVDGFLAQGGMVELVNVDDRLRFDVDLRAVRGAGLGLSSHVLKLARRVRE